MIFDVTLGNFGAVPPQVLVDTARAADEHGFRAIWTADHLLAPSSYPQFGSVLEPLIVLSHVAAVTQRIRLGTSVIVLPMRSPFVVAKQAASLDVLSGGRLILGLGVGSVEGEYANVHANYHNRGARLDEAIALFRHLWSGSREPFAGRYYGYQDGVFAPLPLQGRDLPLLIGGRSEAALKRVAREAAIWQTTTAGPDIFPSLVAQLRALPGGERVEVGSVFPFSGDLADARARLGEWERAGAQHLSLNLGPPEGRLQRLEQFAAEFGIR